MSLELIIAGALLVSLTFYVSTGGADYGSGVWHLFSRGPRAQAQRELIGHALGPIWEAHHVWLILVVVILFTAYPIAYATISTALHIPLTVLLIGIVLRGTSYVFRSSGIERDRLRDHWDTLFTGASLLTPLLLGVLIGAISTGGLVVTNRDFTHTYLFPWLQPFPVAVGIFTVAIFAYLAASYLILETDDAELQEAFRWRAIGAALTAGVLEELVLLLSRNGAPMIWNELTGTFWGVSAQFGTAATGFAGIVFLWQKRFRLACACAIGQVTLTLWAWAFALFPYLVPPDLTIINGAAPAPTLRLLLILLCAGAVLLFPSLYYLYSLFKHKVVFGELTKGKTHDTVVP